jgi:hypothetical protein
VSVVQALLSLQLIATLVQPVAALHESAVHALPSLHPIGVFSHVPFAHESVVQTLLSLHPAELRHGAGTVAGGESTGGDEATEPGRGTTPISMSRAASKGSAELESSSPKIFRRNLLTVIFVGPRSKVTEKFPPCLPATTPVSVCSKFGVK